MKILSDTYFVDLDYSLFYKFKSGEDFRGYSILNLSFINGNPKFTAKALFKCDNIFLNGTNTSNDINIFSISDFEEILNDDGVPF